MRIAEFTFDRPRDVAWSAERSRLLGSLAGLGAKRRASCGKAVKEIVRYAISLGKTGTIQFGLRTKNKQQIEIVIRYPSGDEHGASDDDVDWAMIRSWVDDVKTAFDDSMFEVRLAEPLPAESPQIPPDVASDWATALATRNRTNALSLSQRRITELAENLKSAQQHGVDLQSELDNVRSLNQTLELLALVASKTDNSVIILDAAHCVEWVNDSFVRMTGFETDEVRGKPLIEIFFAGDTDSTASQALAAAFVAGHGLSQEILHQRKDGRTYWASLSITPAFSDDGTIHRWIGIASDATRRRHAQEALRQAKEEAELASRVKSEFLANMSHEIRTPMNAIIGMSELTLETPVNDEQREYLTTILDSAESLLRLLNDILDLSKIEAQKLTIESVDFHLAETLRDALKPFAFQARQNGIRFELTIPLDVPERLVGDPARLRQIVANLAANAIKFTPEEGTICVSVSVAEMTAETAALRFTVQDTGIGISNERLQLIFEAFRQADSSTSRSYGGTGLGLTISKQLVELMDGTIGVESTEGVGSTFHFEICFPLARNEIAHATLPDAAEPSPKIRRPLRVLVTDDNRANRQLAGKILAKRNHFVEEASSGAEALQRLKHGNFDVVLMDVQMPEMDGFDTTAAIRQLADELTVQPYIVALTAHAMQGDRERCLAAGMDAYIAKPLRAKQLMALMAAVDIDPATEDESTSSEHAPPATLSDFSAALKRLEGDDELLMEQMKFYLEDTPILVRDIDDAVNQKDGKKLQMSSHRLRGLSAGFDAHELVDVAARLEDLGATESFGDAPDQQRHLRDAWEQTCASLKQYLRNNAQGAVA